MKNSTRAAASAALIFGMSMPIQASASECGLSCCIGAGIDGVSSNVGLSISLQYDSMYMKTLKQGTSKLSSKQVIDRQLAPLANTTGTMAMYTVPTSMTMQKISANIAYRMDEDNAFLLTVPYVINDMDMQMGMKMGPMLAMPASTTYSSMKMATIRGLGDVSLMYLRDIYKDADIRTRTRISVGIGIKAPTGKSKARVNTSGNLVHMMMQAGTGSWDGVASLNGVLGFGEHEDGGALVLIAPSLFYQFNSRNSLGYKVGNRLNYDLSTRYRLTSKFNVKLDLNGVASQHDSTDGTIDARTGLIAYQNVTGNLLDNVANSGLNSLFVSPGFQWVIGGGWNVSGEYRIPVYQNTNGTQMVTDHWFFLRVGTTL